LRTQKMRGTEDKEEPELRKKMKRIRWTQEQN
jgi:hypothetical protein